VAVATVCAVAVIASGTPAYAQDAATQAKTHYDQGKAFFRVGEYALCVQEFEKSFSLVAKSGALFNQARCHEELGEHAKALDYFKKYLAVDPNGAQAIEANARSAALARKLEDAERVRQESLPHPATTPTPAETAPAATNPSAVQASPPPRSPMETSSAIQSREAPSAQSSTKLNLALGTGALGVVGLGLGTFFALNASSDWDDAQKLCPNGSPCNSSEGIALSRDADGSATLATVSFGLSTGLLLAAGYFWFTRPNETQPALTVAPSAHGTGGSVQLNLRF